MTPVTLAGCAALLRQIEEHERMYRSGLFAKCNNDVREPRSNLLSRISAALARQAV